MLRFSPVGLEYSSAESYTKRLLAELLMLTKRAKLDHNRSVKVAVNKDLVDIPINIYLSILIAYLK